MQYEICIQKGITAETQGIRKEVKNYRFSVVAVGEYTNMEDASK